MKFLCPLTPNATNQSTSHPEDKHISLYTVCVYLNVLDCGSLCDYTSTCTFVFLCVTPYASWVVPVPGVCGVLHFQLRRELGLLCGSTPAKSVIYCPQRARRDWQHFLKNLLTPRRETTTSPTPFDYAHFPKNLQTQITRQTQALPSTPP